MDFISLSYTDPNPWMMVSYFGLLLGVIGLAFSMMAGRGRKVLVSIFATLAVLTWGGGLVVSVVTSEAKKAAIASAMEERKAEVAEVYDLKLTDDEYESLRFPDSEPEEKFAVFGSIAQDVEKSSGGFERQTIYLIWQFGELSLAQSADGETFTVLEGNE